MAMDLISSKSFHFKEPLTSDSLLVHYDPTKELTLMCDASSNGVGAILTQIDKQGVEKPVAYASQTLSSQHSVTIHNWRKKCLL